MFESLKTFFLSFLASQEAAFFGTFLQAFTTISIAIYGLFSFNRWRKQKYFEKSSDYAESALNFLDDAHETLLDILEKKKQTAKPEQAFENVMAAFGLARRKARRLGDVTINENLKKYDSILLSLEDAHIDKLSQDDSKKIISDLKRVYKALYDELLEQSLIRYY